MELKRYLKEAELDTYEKRSDLAFLENGLDRLERLRSRWLSQVLTSCADITSFIRGYDDAGEPTDKTLEFAADIKTTSELLAYNYRHLERVCYLVREYERHIYELKQKGAR